MATQSERFRVQWVDTDAGGRIHFTAAFRWVEAVETALYRRLGLPNDELRFFPRRQVEAGYLRVLVYADEVQLDLRVAKVGTSSIALEWEALHEGNVAIEGRYTVVYVDDDGRPRPIADSFKALLAGE